MSHYRRAIRSQVKGLLERTMKRDLPIYTNHKRVLFEHEIPAIVIHTPEETSFRFTESPEYLKRTLTLVVEAVKSADEDLDDSLDILAEQVEGAMQNHDSLGGIVARVTLVGTETEVNPEGDTLIGSVRLTYELVYHTDETPPANLTDLEGIHVHLV